MGFPANDCHKKKNTSFLHKTHLKISFEKKETIIRKIHIIISERFIC